MKRLAFDLPLPPSVNSIFPTRRDNGGRTKSKAYTDWLHTAGWEVRRQAVGSSSRIAGPYVLAIYVNEAMRGDLDNRVKPISDLLCDLAITDDDKHMHSLHVHRVTNISPGQCRVFASRAIGVAEAPERDVE